MTEQPPAFTPPEPLPHVPAAATQPQQQLPPVEPQFPPPVPGSHYPPPAAHHYPVPVAAPRAPLSRRRKVIVATSITAGALALVGLIIGGGFAVGSAIEAFTPQPPVVEPLESGTPGSAIAATPTQCPEDCYFVTDLWGSVPTQESLAALTLFVDYSEEGSGLPVLSSPATEFQGAKEAWFSSGGMPEECMFVYMGSPISDTVAAPPVQDNSSIRFTGSYGDYTGTSWIDFSVRLFETSERAENHMVTLGQQIDNCPRYSQSDPLWSADVARAPALSIPATVGAVGWTEDTQGLRYYVFDIQRSNMVVRASMYTDGTVSERQYRTFMSQLAGQLGDLEPGTRPPATAETACGESQCLIEADARTLAPSAGALAAAGFSADASYATPQAGAINKYSDDLRTLYNSSNGTPGTCYFALSPAPISRDSPQYRSRDDTVIPLGKFTDGTASVVATARVFADPLEAERFPGSLRSPIIECAEYSYDVDGVTRAVAVKPLTLSTSSDAVTSDAWTETFDGGARTVVDLQYLNMIVRMTFDQPAGSGLTSDEIAQYVLETSRQLEALG